MWSPDRTAHRREVKISNKDKNSNFHFQQDDKTTDMKVIYHKLEV